MERALFGVQSGAVPEALDVALERDIKQPANLDVRLTIDSELQKSAVELLKNRPGAVVVLNPQTGEVLAMYSNPAYSLAEVRDESTWIKLNADERNRPLVNRALGAYYIPGSTFKTVTMLAAYMAGAEDFESVCSASGYVAQAGAKVIFDDGGPGEVHGRLGVDKAYEVSCNQYFAELAVKLGPENMKQAAEALGIGAYDRPIDAIRGRRQPEIWNASAPDVARALAPRESTMVTSKNIRPFDLALEGYGQGYAGQMTPLQMALAAFCYRKRGRQIDEAEDRVRCAARSLQASHDA
ncbi:MAG: penicillin-binding transpeptidase domain-containing protein [Pyrinomonadaceae bacterium]